MVLDYPSVMPVTTRSQLKKKVDDALTSPTHNARTPLPPTHDSAEPTRPTTRTVSKLMWPSDADFVRASTPSYRTGFGKYAIWKKDNDDSVVIIYDDKKITLRPPPWGACTKEIRSALSSSICDDITNHITVAFLCYDTVSVDMIDVLARAGMFRMSQNHNHKRFNPTTMFYRGDYESVRMGIWMLEHGVPVTRKRLMVRLTCCAGYRLARDFFQQPSVREAGFTVEWTIGFMPIPRVDDIKIMLTDIFLRKHALDIDDLLSAVPTSDVVSFVDWLIEHNMITNEQMVWSPYRTAPDADTTAQLIARGIVFRPKSTPQMFTLAPVAEGHSLPLTQVAST